MKKRLVLVIVLVVILSALARCATATPTLQPATSAPELEVLEDFKCVTPCPPDFPSNHIIVVIGIPNWEDDGQVRCATSGLGRRWVDPDYVEYDAAFIVGVECPCGWTFWDFLDWVQLYFPGREWCQIGPIGVYPSFEDGAREMGIEPWYLKGSLKE